MNSHNVFIDWGRTTIWTSVEPGESYFLYVDFADKKKLVMGEKARILNELLEATKGSVNISRLRRREKDG